MFDVKHKVLATYLFFVCLHEKGYHIGSLVYAYIRMYHACVLYFISTSFYHETERLLQEVLAGQMQRGLWPCEPYGFRLGFGRDTSELELYGSDSECSSVDLLDTEWDGCLPRVAAFMQLYIRRSPKPGTVLNY